MSKPITLSRSSVNDPAEVDVWRGDTFRGFIVRGAWGYRAVRFVPRAAVEDATFGPGFQSLRHAVRWIASAPVCRAVVAAPLLAAFVLLSACGGPVASPTPTSPAPVVLPAPTTPSEAGSPPAPAPNLAAVTCTSGPQFVSYQSTSSALPPTFAAFRYPSGACRLTWSVHNDQDVGCGGGPGWQTYATENLRGDGAWHWDELDRAWPLFGVTTCD